MSFPEEKLWGEINGGWSRMSFKQRKLWETIKRTPEEWTLQGYGPCWVVALIGETVNRADAGRCDELVLSFATLNRLNGNHGVTGIDPLASCLSPSCRSRVLF